MYGQLKNSTALFNAFKFHADNSCNPHPWTKQLRKMEYLEEKKVHKNSRLTWLNFCVYTSKLIPLLTLHSRWNVVRMQWIYFTYPSRRTKNMEEEFGNVMDFQENLEADWSSLVSITFRAHQSQITLQTKHLTNPILSEAKTSFPLRSLLLSSFSSQSVLVKLISNSQVCSRLFLYLVYFGPCVLWFKGQLLANASRFLATKRTMTGAAILKQTKNASV